MLRIIVIATCAFVAAIVGVVSWNHSTDGKVTAAELRNDAVMEVRLYRNGKSTVVGASEVRVRLVQECKKAINTAQGEVPLAISADSVSKLKSNETLVEIVFRSPTPVTPLNKNFDVIRLLIPLSGDYAENGENIYTTIFYAMPTAGSSVYVSGPFRNSAIYQNNLRALVSSFLTH